MEELLERAAAAQPGLVPGPDEIAAEHRRELREQEGIELAQGRLLAAWLGDPGIGAHLIQSMLRPRPESEELLPAYAGKGHLDLGAATVERQGNLGVVTLTRPERLNAENDETTVALETAIDLVLLDPASEVGVLRGGRVEHPRYRGRRVFSSGLDLSELYAGGLSYLFFIVRELGFVAKSSAARRPPARAARRAGSRRPGSRAWRPSRSAAARNSCWSWIGWWRELDAQLSLPASREGIIPGAAALRLPRFTGLSAARRSIMFDEQWAADSPEGRLLVHELADADAIGDVLAAAAERLLAMGSVSVLANRQALRAAHEPLEAFRAFMSTYAIEQARCLTSDALVKNLERTWIGRKAEA